MMLTLPQGFPPSRRDARRRFLASFTVASLQHAALLALLAASGTSIPAPATPAERVVLSLKDFGIGGPASSARGDHGAATPAATIAAPSPAASAPVATVKHDPPAAPAPVSKPVPALRKAPPVTQSKPREASTPSKHADSAASESKNPVTAKGDPYAASATPGGDGVAGQVAGPGAGTGGSGGGGGGASYRAQLIAWLERHKRYPARARAIGLEGKVVMRVAIDRSGKVRSHSLESDGPYAVFVQEAEQMVQRADPFPAVPDGITGDTYEIVVPIDFRLQAEGGRG